MVGLVFGSLYFQWGEGAFAPKESRGPQRHGNVFLLLFNGQKANIAGDNKSRLPRMLNTLYILTSTVTDDIFIYFITPLLSVNVTVISTTET